MESPSLLLREGRIVDPGSHRDEVADLLIVDGRVRRIGPGLEAPSGTKIIDVEGLVLTPGFIDTHVHLREPGFEHKETIASGTAAAAAGGITAVAAMPNTQPPPDTPRVVGDILARARKASVRVHVIACITHARQGRRLAPLASLAAAGAVAFSDDGDPVEDEALMYAALVEAARIGRPLFPHEEFRQRSPGGCMHAGRVAERLGLPGMDPAAEDDMIARDIDLVRRTGGHLHIAHISTAATVELVRQAKAEGLPVTCEVLPHHCILTEIEVEHQGTQAKMAPPLRTAADVEALRTGLADGTVDTIATDHAPHTADEKARPMTEAPFGVVGLETAVGLCLTELVHGGVLELPAMVARWTCAPAGILGLPGGHLRVGDPGDVTLLDLERRWVVDPQAFRSRSRNTPFAGRELRGRAVGTVVGGRLVHAEAPLA